MGGGSPKQTLQDLFSSRNVIAGLDLQGHLGQLAANLPPTWNLTPDRLATEFTLFPYYLAFQSTTVRERALLTLIEGSLSGLHLLLGLAPADSRVKNLRFCTDCLQEMERRHGEFYWRLSQQLPGVLVCQEHGCVLLDSGVPLLLGNRQAFIAATVENCSRGRPVVPASLADLGVLPTVAQSCRNALQSPPQARSPQNWAVSYRSRLIQAGLASAEGRVNQESVEGQLQSHFGEALLPLLADVGASDLAWLRRLTQQRERALHPLFHILFQEFLDHLVSNQPFGEGPWPCLNPLSPHQGELLIGKVSIHRNHGRVVGVFECDCGFAYTRNILSESGTVGRARPLRFGEAFDQMLRHLAGEHVGIRETARRLHVNARTIRLRAAKLGLDTDWKPARPPSLVAADTDEHRRAWNALMRSHTAAGRKDLSRMAPALHTWLYRHDRKWLAAHQPAAKRFAHPARHDWGNLDEQWKQRVADLAEEIRYELPPRKVTLAEISRRTEEPAWLPNHLRRLPCTQVCLKRLRDTDADFQARRVAWAARQLAASGQPLVEWRICRMAGLGKRLAPEVEAALVKTLSPVATTL
jgi:hypothetical protein